MNYEKILVFCLCKYSNYRLLITAIHYQLTADDAGGRAVISVGRGQQNNSAGKWK
jgi:hypothetical protein